MTLETRSGGAEKNLERQIRAFHWIRLLAELPSRTAGSNQEREAGIRVEAWLRDVGLPEVAFEPVSTRARPGWVLAVHLGVASVACAAGGVTGFALAAVAAWSFRREQGGLLNRPTRSTQGPLPIAAATPLLTRWLPKPASRNVVARVGSHKPRRRVVLTAHLDTAQASRIFSHLTRAGARLRSAAPRCASAFGLLAVRVASMLQRGAGARAVASALPVHLLGAAMLITATAALGAEGTAIGIARGLAAVVLALGAAAGVEWALAPGSPGANANASGVAALLTCAEQLVAQLPPDVELCCAATGAGEVGSCGMHALLDAHPEWLSDRTAFVNFACVGGGALHYVRSEGGLVRVVYPPMLAELARRVAASGALGAVTPVDLPIGPALTDGHVAAARGGQVLSLISLEAGLPGRRHRPDDIPEHLDMETVIRAADFGTQVVSAHLRGAAEPLTYV